jgi:hypothetical protein
MKFAVYTKGSSNDVYKDGHRMFMEDVVKDLNRKSYLEEKFTFTNKPSTSCIYCIDWFNSSKRYVYCPDCGRKLRYL